jgi:hypothetical protein
MSGNKGNGKQYKTLLAVLANGCPIEARQLLNKHSKEDAKNPQELELKLAKMYAYSPNKIEIEQAFAEMHPHKEFILKYAKQKPVETVSKKNEEGEIIKETILSDKFNNAEGYHEPCSNPNCNYCRRYFSNLTGSEKTSEACGCKSSFEGNDENKNQVLIIGIVGIVAISALILYFKNNK